MIARRVTSFDGLSDLSGNWLFSQDTLGSQ